MKKIVLIMPPFWDPICPPQGIVSLKSYLEQKGYKIHIFDFNADEILFNLQRKYFDAIIANFPHWKFQNIFRNGPRYFTRHQLVHFFAEHKTERYKELIKLILNFDGMTLCPESLISDLDLIIEEKNYILKKKLDAIIKEIEPDIVGCSTLESTLPSSLLILQEVKKINPKIKTVLGGPGPAIGNTLSDDTLQNIIKQCGWIDTLFFGEAEQLFEYYLDGKLPDKKIISIQDLKDLQNFPEQNALLNINQVPYSDYDGLPINKYIWLSMYTSRGCPFKCSFCFENHYWVKYREKNIENIINEMDFLSKKYKKSNFYFCDSIFNHIVNQFSEEILKRDNKVKLDCYMRITNDCLDINKVKLWAKAGLERVRIGIESASGRVLKLMNKHITIDNMEKSLINFSRSGIFTSTLWIAGFPGETDEDFNESLKFLKDNHQFIYQADIWEYICPPIEILDDGKTDNNFSTKPVYPDDYNDLLLLKYYDLKNDEGSPKRFEKIRKFEKLRMEMGIPNPYSLSELRIAKRRWLALNGNKEIFSL